MKPGTWDPLEGLTGAQLDRLHEYARALVELNRRVNLVSAASAADVMRRHLVHSLALSFRSFPAGASVVDIGAGAGLPSIPLAIRFPDVRFTAVDAIAKKSEAVRLFARRLGLANVDAWCGRAEEWPGLADYAVSRATAPLVDLWSWFEHGATPAGPPAGGWQARLMCLKGGDLSDELAALRGRFPFLAVERIPLGPLLRDSYFAGKEIVAVGETVARRDAVDTAVSAAPSSPA